MAPGVSFIDHRNKTLNSRFAGDLRYLGNNRLIFARVESYAIQQRPIDNVLW